MRGIRRKLVSILENQFDNTGIRYFYSEKGGVLTLYVEPFIGSREIQYCETPMEESKEPLDNYRFRVAVKYLDNKVKTLRYGMTYSKWDDFRTINET